MWPFTKKTRERDLTPAQRIMLHALRRVNREFQHDEYHDGGYYDRLNDVDPRYVRTVRMPRPPEDAVVWKRVALKD